MRSELPWLLLMAAASVGAAVGCSGGGGRDNERHPIRGVVTFDGQPLRNGSIRFEPLGAKDRIASGAAVRDGRYVVAASHGLPVGRYVVRLSAPAPLPPDAQPDPTKMGGGLPTPEELIPPEFGNASRVEVEVQPGLNQFDVEIAATRK